MDPVNLLPPLSMLVAHPELQLKQRFDHFRILYMLCEEKDKRVIELLAHLYSGELARRRRIGVKIAAVRIDERSEDTKILNTLLKLGYHICNNAIFWPREGL